MARKMAGTMASSKFCAVFLLLAIFFPASLKASSCFTKKTPNIRADHLFHKKTKPVILGHRGNPKKFQENTIEGFKSLVDLGADGLEVDVYLTDHDQLVLFHDDNAMKLTGTDKLIWEMTPSEIQNLTYKQSLTYGKMTYNYAKRLKVGLLEDLLHATKDSDLLIYIEMKPSKTVYDNINADTERSRRTVKAVIDMVTRLGLEKKVFLASLDYRKALLAKQMNPNIVVGSFYLESYWSKNIKWYQDFKNQLKTFPGLNTCLDTLPADRTLMDTLFKRGSIFKSINASFIDLQFSIYSNNNITNNAFKIFRNNYNLIMSAGASTIYDMKLNAAETDASESRVQYLIDQRAERLATDDVTRLRKKLGRGVKSGQAEMKKTSALFLVLALFSVTFYYF